VARSNSFEDFLLEFTKKFVTTVLTKNTPFRVRAEVCDQPVTGTRVLPIREEAIMATPAETQGADPHAPTPHTDPLGTPNQPGSGTPKPRY
jgi:hypothetical protein